MSIRAWSFGLVFAAVLWALILAVLAVLVTLVFPNPTKSDVPVTAQQLGSRDFVTLSQFEAVGSGGGPWLSGQDTEAAAAPLQPRTPSPAPSPAPATRDGAPLASRRNAGTPQRGQDSRPTGSATGTQRGTASTYGPGYDGRLALPSGPGHRVRVCGAGGCIVRVSNDAGPSLAMQRLGRIVDLDVADFETVCGVPWTRGLCRVMVTP